MRGPLTRCRLSSTSLTHLLAHSLRFALDDAYRAAVEGAWSGEWGTPALSRWMRDLGYHASRHADEFGAYVLTEPPSFWRGRVAHGEVAALRERLLPDGAGDAWSALALDPGAPYTVVT